MAYILDIDVLDSALKYVYIDFQFYCNVSPNAKMP